MADTSRHLRLCLVTPCLNAGAYAGEALSSVVNQPGFEHVDYIVMDGGSTDGSKDVIAAYASRLKHWQTGADGGLYHAVEEGFRYSDAEIMGWLNADDMLCPWTIRLVLDIFTQLPQVDFITSKHPLVANSSGVVYHAALLPGVNRHDFREGMNLPGQGWPATNFISQESTFWRRSLWESVGGGFDHTLRLACDFELWARFLERTDLYVVESPMAIFRAHGSNLSLQAKDEYARQAEDVLLRYGWRKPSDFRSMMRRANRAKAVAINLPLRALRHPGRSLVVKSITFDEQTGEFLAVERGTVCAALSRKSRRLFARAGLSTARCRAASAALGKWFRRLMARASTP
jgi:glycosyltransferase involved in cell wall biosynthesis